MSKCIFYLAPSILYFELNLNNQKEVAFPYLLSSVISTHVPAPSDCVAGGLIRADHVILVDLIEVYESVAAGSRRSSNQAAAVGTAVKIDAAASCALRIVGVVAHRGDLIVEWVHSWKAFASRSARTTVCDRRSLAVLKLIEVHTPRRSCGCHGEGRHGDEGCNLHCSVSTLKVINVLESDH